MMISVGGGNVEVGKGEGVFVGMPRVGDGVTGSVTSRSNFWPEKIMEVLFNPFQFIRSESGTSYRPAIYESVSPLWTV